MTTWPLGPQNRWFPTQQLALRGGDPTEAAALQVGVLPLASSSPPPP